MSVSLLHRVLCLVLRIHEINYNTSFSDHSINTFHIGLTNTQENTYRLMYGIFPRSRYDTGFIPKSLAIPHEGGMR